MEKNDKNVDYNNNTNSNNDLSFQVSLSTFKKQCRSLSRKH